MAFFGPVPEKSFCIYTGPRSDYNNRKYSGLVNGGIGLTGRLMINKVRSDNHTLFVFLILFNIILFAGCNSPRDHLATFNRHFKNMDYESSVLFAHKKLRKGKKPKGEQKE